MNFSSSMRVATFRRSSLFIVAMLALTAVPVIAATQPSREQLVAAALPQSSPQAQPAQASIRAVLEQQTAAWNRGDVEGFMRGYKDSPDTTFISKQVEHGYQAVLARYKQKFTSRDAMGTLAFHHLQVRPLCADYAMVTGEFHLTRTAAGGGNSNGVFSLLFQKTPEGWRILLDHTTDSAS